MIMVIVLGLIAALAIGATAWFIEAGLKARPDMKPELLKEPAVVLLYKV